MSVSLNTAASVNMQPIDLNGMDLETALMMVQSQRANLLEGQLAAQMDAVKQRNDQIGKLNEALSALNNVKALFPGDAKADTKLTDKVSTEKIQAQQGPANEALKAAGFENGISSLSGSQYGSNIQGDTTMGKVDAAINEIKGKIDAANNSNQMDMLRLQSLTNKRNEAFDLMTNFIKKMQDSRSSIIGNMR